MVIRVIPRDFACSYMRPSTSLDTALVHSADRDISSVRRTGLLAHLSVQHLPSRMANFGLW